MKKNFLITLGIVTGMSIFCSIPTYATPTQSDRWVGTDDRWQVSDNHGGYIKNCWFQDDVTGHWYMIGAEDGSVMYSGLVTDQSTGKSYLLNINHDGTFGRMLTVNGVYNVNGKDVYMTFNQEHDGTFGAILSGLAEVRSTGVNERTLDRIPTDEGNASASSSQSSNTNPSKTSSGNSKSSSSLTEEEKRMAFSKDGSGKLTGEEQMLYDLYDGDYSKYEALMEQCANMSLKGSSKGVTWN